MKKICVIDSDIAKRTWFFSYKDSQVEMMDIEIFWKDNNRVVKFHQDKFDDDCVEWVEKHATSIETII